VNNAAQIKVKKSNLSLRRIPDVIILEVKKKCRRKLLIRIILHIVIIALLAEKLGESMDRQIKEIKDV
jgi:hypothetical protein